MQAWVGLLRPYGMGIGQSGLQSEGLYVSVGCGGTPSLAPGAPHQRSL